MRGKSEAAQADCICLNYAGNLSGGGTLSQLAEGFTGWEELARGRGVPLIKAWPQGKGALPAPDVVLTGAGDVQGTYQQVREGAERVIDLVTSKGLKRPLIYCYGYTSYLLFAFHSLKHRVEGMRLVWGDCSPPDTDALSLDLEPTGLPITRFHGPAYQDTFGVLYGWHECMPQSRIPPGMREAILTAQPFSERYVQWLRGFRALDRQEARRRTKGLLPGLEDLGPDTLLFILASSDIWDPTIVGKWLTSDLHQRTMEGTENLFRALDRVGQALDQEAVLVIDQAGARAMEQRGVKGLTHLRVVQSPGLPREPFLTAVVAATLTFNRASHAVTSAETAAMGKAQCILPLPPGSYMNVMDFTEDVRKRELALVANQASENDIFHISLTAARDPDHPAIIATRDKGTAEFDRFHGEAGNFFTAMGRLMGGD